MSNKKSKTARMVDEAYEKWIQNRFGAKVQKGSFNPSRLPPREKKP